MAYSRFLVALCLAVKPLVAEAVAYSRALWPSERLSPWWLGPWPFAGLFGPRSALALGRLSASKEHPHQLERPTTSSNLYLTRSGQPQPGRSKQLQLERKTTCYRGGCDSARRKAPGTTQNAHHETIRRAHRLLTSRRNEEKTQLVLL